MFDNAKEKLEIKSKNHNKTDRNSARSDEDFCSIQALNSRKHLKRKDSGSKALVRLFLVLIQYIVVRLLIFLLTYFLLYTINETGKNDITKGRLKIILRYAIFYLSVRVFASSSLFLMFT